MINRLENATSNSYLSKTSNDLRYTLSVYECVSVCTTVSSE